jgi:outer membrane protein TolC
MQSYFAPEFNDTHMKEKFCILILFCTLNASQIMAQNESMVTLNQCINAALNYNPAVKESTNESIISGISVKSAQSQLFPVVSSQISGGFSNEYKFDNNYRTRNATVSADQIVWQNGKIKSSIKQARYIQKTSEFSLEARKQEIIFAVKTIYFTCLEQDQLYQSALENVSKTELFLKYASERYRIGVGRKSDVLKAESDLAESGFQRDVYLNLHRKAQNELAMYTGLSVVNLTKLQNVSPDEYIETYSKQTDSLYTIVVRNYPELQVINNTKLSQQAKIDEAKAMFYPQLSVSAGYDWNYNPVLQEQKGWYSLLNLRWNIFSGNERRYKLQSEKIKMNIDENQTDAMKDLLMKEVKNRIISIEEAEHQIILTDRLMKTTSENLEITKAQYKAGTGSMIELADARTTDLAAHQKNIQAIATLQIALASLERLIGNTNKDQN